MDLLPYHAGVVLVVDDDPGLLDVGTAMLESLGYLVLAANSPEAAFQLAEEHGDHIDTLLTDVIMPGMNGLDLARLVASRFPRMGVLFMSGYSDEVVSEYSVTGERVSFIQKPFTMETLATALRDVRGEA